MNVILGALVRRIKQRAYLDTDEEIARWIEEYCEQSNSHKHGVSGKRPSVDEINKFLDDYGFVVPYDGSNKFYDDDKIKHAKAGIEFVMNFLDKGKAACASGAVDKTVSEGNYGTYKSGDENYGG